MQGRSRLDRELLDAEMIAGHLVPPGSVFAFLAAHRTELFPDSFTADLFPSRTGRPSLPADLVGSVLVLVLYDLSDPQTADALKFEVSRQAMLTQRRTGSGRRCTATRRTAAARPALTTVTAGTTRHHHQARTAAPGGARRVHDR